LRTSATGEPVRGTSPGRMEYLAWGSGPRTLLFVGGGPPSTVPGRSWAVTTRRYFAPYTDAGYRVWMVTRPRGMPRGHSVADIARDYEEFVRDVIGEQVDLLMGQSFGGLVVQHLAVLLGDRLGHLVVVASGWGVSARTRETDLRLAHAIERRDKRTAGAAYAEYVAPQDGLAPLRRVLAPLVAQTMLSGRTYGPDDVLAEALAEAGCDTRAVLAHIRTPTLVVAGDRDRFFPVEVVRETVLLIPGARVRWYPGQGHAAVCSSRQVAADVLADIGG
jgi:pimeloyl-ACP methyl ester carboxylesterase